MAAAVLVTPRRPDTSGNEELRTGLCRFRRDGLPFELLRSASGTSANFGLPWNVTTTRLPATTAAATRVCFHSRSSLVTMFAAQNSKTR